MRVTAHQPITRVVAGVQFRDGVADTDNPGALAYFRRRSGYSVEAAPSRARHKATPAKQPAKPQPSAEGDKA